MNTLKKKLSCRIARRADQQGARPLAWNQAGVEKSVTGTTSSHNDLEGNLTENFSQQGPPDAENQSRTTKKASRQRWTREEYIQVMIAVYEAKLTPTEGSNTEQTYKLWREKNLDNRPAINANKLANIRRDIAKNKRLEDITLQQLQNNIRDKIEKQNTDKSSNSMNNDSETTEMENVIMVNDAPSTENLDQVNIDESFTSD